MLLRAYLPFTMLLSLVLLSTNPLKAQVEPSASGGPTADDDSTMMTPPPVNGFPYPTTAGSETRSNNLATSVTVNSAYIDNVLPDETVTPIGNFTGTITPGVTLDRSTPRQMEQITYSPVFSFYEPTSTLNSIDQSANVAAQFHLSPHLALSVRDFILKTSNVFNESYPFSSSITGSTPTSTPTVIAPFVERFTNTTTGVVSYQFAANAMIGGGVLFESYNFPDQAQTQGFYDSRSIGGTVFYSRRLSRAQYAGVAYEYERIRAYPLSIAGEARIHSLLPFYTVYFNRTFSLSISAGMQRVGETESTSFQSNSWAPSVVTSVGWQGRRGNIAASYSRSVTAGGGIVGTFNANSVSGSGGWQFSRTWSGSASAFYRTFVSLGQTASRSVSSDYTAAQVSFYRTLGARMNVSFGYQHLNQNYSDIAVIAANPNSNREFVSITYQLTRPLGR